MKKKPKEFRLNVDWYDTIFGGASGIRNAPQMEYWQIQIYYGLNTISHCSVHAWLNFSTYMIGVI
jgi:hypothetical protein